MGRKRNGGRKGNGGGKGMGDLCNYFSTKQNTGEGKKGGKTTPNVSISNYGF